MVASVVQAKTGCVAGATANGPWTVTLGAPPTAGNWLVCFSCHNGPNTALPAAAAGWNRVVLTPQTPAGGFTSPGYYYKRVAGGESATQNAVPVGTAADGFCYFEIGGLEGAPLYLNHEVDKSIFEFNGWGDYNFSYPGVTATEDVLVLAHFVTREGSISSLSGAGISTIVAGSSAGNRTNLAAYGNVAAGTLIDPVPTIVSNGTNVGGTIFTLRTGEPAKSYFNAGGSGNRRVGSIQIKKTADLTTVNSFYNLINGLSDNVFYFGGFDPAGKWLEFDFGEARVIDEAQWIQDSGTTQGIWKWQGSNDGSTWTDIGGTFTLGGGVASPDGNTTQTITTLNANTTAFRKYRLHGVSGLTSSGPYIREIRFRIDPGGPGPQTWQDRISIGPRSGQVAVTMAGSIANLANAGLVVDGIRPSVNPAVDSYFTGGTQESKITFDFGSPKLVTGGYMWTDFVGPAERMTPAIKWQGSNDGSSWTDLTADFALEALVPTVGVTLTDFVADFGALLAGNATAYRYMRLFKAVGVATDNTATMMEFVFFASDAGDPPSGITVDIPKGDLELQGFAPTVEIDAGTVVDVPKGELELVGFAPVVTVETAPIEVDVGSGSIQIRGYAPFVAFGVAVDIPRDRLQVQGFAPLVSTQQFGGATQQAIVALAEVEREARASQLAIVALAEIIPDVEISQQAIVVLAEIVPDVRATQQAVVVLADGSPCVTQRCQIWKITRTDGVVFRFTSLDRPFEYGGEIYKSCSSLNPSASENASTLGSVGNIELEGIIDDESITEADLYGGKFDDARVTVDLVAWGSQAESPRRLAAGWTGELSQGETGFRLEVLGPGTRLDQQALVTMVTPGCRWSGLSDPRCGIDVEALKIEGTVTLSRQRGIVFALLDGDGAGRQWANGILRFIDGENAGEQVEIKSVDFGTGEIVTWASPPYIAQPGDLIEILPGCDLDIDGGCAVYNNRINFGGFPDVPGQDSLMETPNAKV